MSYLLIVDDELDSSEPVARFLRRAGHEVACAPNGRDAIATLSDRVPDLILLDMRMPEMSGLDVLDVIRSYLRWQEVPVIVLTAYADAPDVRRAADLNATTVLDKIDLDLGQLLRTVETYLHGDDDGDGSTGVGGGSGNVRMSRYPH